MKWVDLHTHTTVSDGVLSPAELVERAAERDVETLAITDHDAIDAIDEARAAAPEGMTILAGAELTCHVGGREAHVLTYVPERERIAFREKLEEFRHGRETRAREIVERLNAEGIEIDFADVERVSGAGTIARPHVAQALLERGVVGSIDEAFRRFIGRGRFAFVSKPTLEPERAFEIVHAAGGVAGLAHPGTFRRDDLIPILVEAGMDALEVRHTEHATAAMKHYEKMASRLGLMPVGGSDFHGTKGHRSRLGRPRIPREWARDLVARLEGPR